MIKHYKERIVSFGFAALALGLVSLSLGVVVPVSKVSAATPPKPISKPLVTTGCTKTGSVEVEHHTDAVTTDLTKRVPSYRTLQQSKVKSTCVKNVQTFINYFCSPKTKLVVDGYYGPKTAHAVRAYQKVFGQTDVYPMFHVNHQAILVDGIVGPQVWGLMQVTYAYAGGQFAC